MKTGDPTADDAGHRCRKSATRYDLSMAMLEVVRSFRHGLKQWAEGPYDVVSVVEAAGCRDSQIEMLSGG